MLDSFDVDDMVDVFAASDDLLVWLHKGGCMPTIDSAIMQRILTLIGAVL